MKLRYPGARPFETEQQHVFFGRTSDINNLYRLIKLEPLVVLYGKSGTGKSSLLNAGVIPRAAADGYFVTARIRFNACPPAGTPEVKKPIDTTLETLCEITAGEKQTQFLKTIVPGEQSLWLEVKKYQLATGGQKGILLLFDQYEELFTYPTEDVLEFRRQLAEAIFTPVPQRFWDALELQDDKAETKLTSGQLSLFQQPPHVKIVLTIRSDRLHLLHQMTDYLPSILKKCYELGPLEDSQTLETIFGPAGMDGDFTTPPFQYHPQALSMIMEFLTEGRKQKAELTQLQIICNYVEKKVRENNWSVVLPDHVRDLDSIIEHYYFDKIDQITDPEQQLAARHLIEEGLLFEEEERRLSLYEGQIYQVYTLSPETLVNLVDSHLLRAEPSLQGGYTYELSHDSLVGPVLKAKNTRLQKEREMAEALAREERERELRRERYKRTRALRVAAAMTVLAVLSLSGLAFGTMQYDKARRSERAAVDALNNFLAEKRERERLQVNRLMQDAETLASAWRAQPDLVYPLEDALEKLREARTLDSQNVAIESKIREYETLLKLSPR